MSAVKNKDSKIEVEFRKRLRKGGVRYIKNPKGYFGKPDIVLKQGKVVIFIDSCFWHGCRWHCRIPKSRRNYWVPKIQRNKDRAKIVNRTLKKEGWRVVRVWEHQLQKNFDKSIIKLAKLL